MARPLRNDFAGALHHLTSRGNNKGDIFLDEDDRLRFLALLAATVIRFGWRLYAWVLMTNHFHLEVETPEANLSRGMHWLNTRYVQWFNRKHDRCGHLFQRRFEAKLIEKESYMLEVARYVILNPVAAHMVARPEEYRWSSYHATAGFEPVPEWLDAAGLLGNFGNDVSSAREEYRRFVDGGIGLERRLWDELKGQIYLGRAEWIDRMQKRIDEEPRSEEHPRAQRNPGRPAMEDVLEAVSVTFDIKPEEIRQRSATTARQVAAWLAFEEGLIRQSEIAAALGIRRSRVSSLVSGCRRARDDDPLHELIEAARSRMKRRLPKWTPPPSEFNLPFLRKRPWIPGAP
jgi:putative transposase